MDLPETTQLRWIARRTATLLELGAEPVRGLVLPTNELFPDRFDGSPPSVAALLRRIQSHAGLTDLEVELSIVTPDGEETKVGGCSGGACGGGGGGGGGFDTRLDRVGRTKDGTFTVAVGAGEIKNPVVLTTALVRSVSFMFMSEAGAYEDLSPDEREPATDLAAVLLGFGVLVANGSYIYMKGCGGVQVHSATRMTATELGVALALFCRYHGIPDGTASRHLDTTPREAFAEASAWVDSNAKLVKLLRTDRALVEAGDFALSETTSWLSRALGLGRPRKGEVRTPTTDDLAELEQSLRESAARGGGDGKAAAKADAAKAKRLAELRALVDESLGDAKR